MSLAYLMPSAYGRVFQVGWSRSWNLLQPCEALSLSEVYHISSETAHPDDGTTLNRTWIFLFGSNSLIILSSPPPSPTDFTARMAQ